MDQSAIDASMMMRCIALSATAPARGEIPIASVICRGDTVVAEATNEVRAEGDVTRHAELIAMSRAQKILGRKNLSDCTLYSTVEPCPMCSFPIRETRMRRVVYAMSSPVMGGVTKWNVLRDTQLSNVVPEVFGAVPEVVAGLCAREAADVWRKWNPFIWSIIKRRGCFGPSPAANDPQRMEAIRPVYGWLRSLLIP